MVFCLVPKKSSATYTAVFSIIKDKMESLGMNIEIQTFRSDLETAAYSSMKSLFPQLSIECCFFHFGQANWRKIAELGLRTKYVEDLDFSLQIRMFTALAFLPPDFVKLMEIKFSIFLNFFDVFSMFFRCFFDVFFSMFCLSI